MLTPKGIPLSYCSSGPSILHRCHRSNQSRLQGAFSYVATLILVVVNVEQGEQTLFSSPRNSIDGHLALLKSTNCNVMISPEESNVGHILSKRDMRHLNVEGLKELLSGDFIEHYEYNKTFEEAAQDPFIVIHTSGSTGLPKPIILYHGGVACLDNHRLIPSFDGFENQLNVAEGPFRVFTSLPPYHVSPQS